jgi:hypothetical protein
MSKRGTCIDCGKVTSYWKAKRCWDCYKTNSQNPINNGNYKNGYHSKNKLEFNHCINCGKRITPYAKKCHSCDSKRGKTLNYCVDCNKIINRLAKRCRSCAGKKRFEKIEIRKKQSLPGSKNPNWQGGKTSLKTRIKMLIKYKEWVYLIFKRDNFTCQECGQVGHQLEAHHLKSFSELLSEFLNKYYQYSPIDDKEILLQFAINYKPFWNISNGQTLCKSCHSLTDNYGNKKGELKCLMTLKF